MAIAKLPPPLAFYAGNSSVSGSGSISFQNSNNVTFGLSSNLITASVNAGGISIQPGGNTSGTSGLVSNGVLILAGGNNITVSQVGNAFTLSGATVVGQPVNFSAGTTSNALGSVVFSNSNNLSFGLSGSTLTGSVPAQTNQSIGIYASSQTTGGASSSTVDARSLSIVGAGNVSVGVSAGSVVISGAGANSIGFYATGNTTQNSSTSLNQSALSFNALGAMTMGYSNGSIQASAPATSLLSATGIVSVATNGSTVSIGVPNQTLGIYASSNTTGATSFSTVDIRSLSVVGAGNVSVGMTGGSLVVSGSGGGGNQLTLAGNTSGTLALISTGTLTLAGGNNITLSQNGNAVTVSAPATSLISATGAASVSLNGSTISIGVPPLSFISATGIVSTSINGSTISIGAIQSNQTIGLYASSQTTGGASSSTFDARSLTIVGAGNVSVGMTGGSLVISGTGGGGGANSLGFYATGNTTQNSSTTLNQSALTFNAIGALSLGYSNGSIQLSNPATSSISGTGAVSVQVNGSTISIGVPATSLISGTGIVSVSVNGSTISIGASQSVQTQNLHDLTLAGNTAGTLALVSSGTLTLAGGNGITLSQNGNAVTISGGGGATAISGIAVSNATYTSGTVSFTNSNNISFGSVNGTAISASYALNLSAAGGTSNAVSGISFLNSNNVSFGVSTGAGVASITASIVPQSNQTIGLYASSQTTGGASSSTVDARSFSIVGAGNISVGLTGGSFVISQTGGGGGVSTAGLYALGNTTQNSSTMLNLSALSFNAIGAMTMGYSNGSIQASLPATSSISATGAVSVSVNGSTISVGAPATSLISGASGIGKSINGSTISLYNQANSVYEPFPILTGTAFSSHAPASFWFNKFTLFDPVAVSNINVVKSFNAAVPTDTLASSGINAFTYSHGITLFSRQNYGTGLTNLTAITAASGGLTASLSYTSISQSAYMSWVTNSTGGISTFSTTSSNAGWSNYFTGPMLFPIPFVTTLVDGEYFIAHAHSSTTGTTGNSNFTLLSVSNLHIAPQVVNVGVLGSSNTQASLNPFGAGVGIASAITTNNTMAMSVITGATRNDWYLAMSNA